jgi:hypothetical protein
MYYTDFAFRCFELELKQMKWKFVTWQVLHNQREFNEINEYLHFKPDFQDTPENSKSKNFLKLVSVVRY